MRYSKVDSINKITFLNRLLSKKEKFLSKIIELDQHKQLLLLALPMILSNITVPLLGLVDTAVIGHLPHAYFLGGSTIGAMIITSVIWLCGFLRMSTTGLSAQAFGENNSNKNLLVLFRGISVAFVIGLILILMQTPFINGALHLAGGSEKVQLYARQYSEIRLWGFPAALANLTILGWLIGNHQTKAVMWLLIVTNLINVCLDLLFVFVFHWQVQGVAFATLIAEYSGMFLGLSLITLRYKTSIVAFFTSSKHKSDHLLTFLFAPLFASLLEKASLSIYFTLNRDILIRTLCLEACFIFITFQGAKLGDNVVAANAILLNFLLLISFGLDGIANATEAIVGKAWGKRDFNTLKNTVNIALLWTAIFALSYSLLFAFAGKSLLLLISDIPSVVDYAEKYLSWMVWLPIAACWCYLFDGVYVGMMKAKVMRNSMIIATFGCFFPVWWLLNSTLSPEYSNHALWAAFLVFMLARGITLAWHFRANVLTSQGEN